MHKKWKNYQASSTDLENLHKNYGWLILSQKYTFHLPNNYNYEESLVEHTSENEIFLSLNSLSIFKSCDPNYPQKHIAWWNIIMQYVSADLKTSFKDQLKKAKLNLKYLKKSPPSKYNTFYIWSFSKKDEIFCPLLIYTQ